jgi:hypothetical protein
MRLFMHQQQRGTKLLLASTLAASTCLLGAIFYNPAAGRPNGARASSDAIPTGTQAVSREEPPKLYPVWVNGKTGFIDRTGKLVIPPKFGGEYLWMGGRFSDGMARTQTPTQERPGHCCRFGYINAEGRVVVEPQYWEAKDFSEGLAAVLIGDRWGYIDREGRTALGPKWVAADSFSEGLASVYEDGVGHGYIDRSGRMVIKLEGATAPGRFHDGMAQVMVTPKGGDFNGGGRFEFGYIDRSGRLAVPGPFEKVGDFSEGLAAVQVKGRWGYVDSTGHFAIEPAYDSATSFHDGQATVASGGKYSFIDKSGKKVGECPPQSCDFHEGLAAFESGGRWGYIDRAGHVVIKPKFSEAYDFAGGIAMVMLPGKKMGYIDKTGKYVWPPSK